MRKDARAAGVELTPAEFYSKAFSIVRPVMDAVLADAEQHYGAVFKRCDARWEEATPNGSHEQLCRLIWKEQTLLQLRLWMLTERVEIEPWWTRLRH